MSWGRMVSIRPQSGDIPTDWVVTERGVYEGERRAREAGKRAPEMGVHAPA